MRIERFDQLCEVLDSAHNGIMIVAPSGRVVVFNRAAARVTGLAAEEVLGRPWGEVEPETWEEMKAVLANGESQVGRATPSLTGSTIIANRTPLVLGGRVEGVISIFQDAADYEGVLAELKAYKDLTEELNVIFNSSFDGLWISDARGRVLRVNPTSRRFLGIGEDVIGRQVEDLVAEGYFDKAATTEVLKRRTAVSIIQKSRDGTELLVTGNPVYDEKGEIRLVVINARDLTALKKLQAELEESRALTDKYRSELTSLHDQEDLSSEFIVRSTRMERAFETAIKMARVDSSVLILGESGVGKSLVAKMIHRASARRKGPLVRVDCAGVPASLIEAELFGYVKGAFTGARGEGKPGYFEMSQGGTLLLEEVGELPLNTQAKLLRFLEDNEVVRLGDITPRKIDVRVLAATNRDLEGHGGERRVPTGPLLQAERASPRHPSASPPPRGHSGPDGPFSPAEQQEMRDIEDHFACGAGLSPSLLVSRERARTGEPGRATGGDEPRAGDSGEGPPPGGAQGGPGPGAPADGR